MVIEKLNEIQQYRTRIAELEKQVEAEKREKLANLHTEVGLGSIAELIQELRALGSKRRGGRGRKKAVRAGRKRAKGSRKRISTEVREQIKAALKSGKKTGAQVARDFGISVPTIQNIKKEFGLIKPRRKR